LKSIQIHIILFFLNFLSNQTRKLREREREREITTKLAEEENKGKIDRMVKEELIYTIQYILHIIDPILPSK